MADISKIKPNGATGTEYDLKDATARAAMIPSGGTQGQVLVKKTGTDYDTEWATGGGGTDVEGNPSGSVTSGDLTKIKIGNNIYRVTDLSTIVYEFDSTKSYDLNDFVSYNGQIYVCTSTHTGAWNSSDFLATDLGDYIAWMMHRKLNSEDAADTFNSTKSYAVGDYVKRLDAGEMHLFKCTTAHTGAWNASHFTNIVICNELENKQNKASFSGNTLVL